MNKEVIVLGNAKSIWLKEYVKNIHYKLGNKTYLISYSPLSDGEKQDYEKYNTVIIELQFEGEGNSKIKKMFRIIKAFKHLKGKIDALDIQSPPHSPQAVLLGFLIRYLDAKTITSFWGSDIMRITEKDAKKLRSVIDVTDVINLGTIQLKNAFYNMFGHKYDMKIKSAIYGSPAIEHIKHNKSIPKSMLKQFFNIDSSKITVAIGHNGNRSQQHLQVLNTLNNLEDECKNRMNLILHIGYGLESGYKDELERCCNNLDIDYTIIDKFMDLEEISKLRLATDVLIHAQTTDALSGTIRESIYAETILINPCWINYAEFDSLGIEYERYSSIDEIAQIIERIVNDGTEIDLNKNSRIIDEHYSWYASLEDWTEIIDG